ncbi:hypothetical protein [Neobacillus sp. D3-1R]|uniref:hypothetical protein n=1 Tax=Neobacillus sp. D3-1R TaxID=3445778 RepID=UPI003FA00CD4
MELESVNKQLVNTQEKLKIIENQNFELNEELKNESNFSDTDIETKAISLKSLTCFFQRTVLREYNSQYFMP